jgi:GT2 family glycosyltransferase
METSLIICTIDRLENIKRCLSSVAGQSYRPDEIIIVDASKSNLTKNYISDLKSPGLKVVYIKQKGTGISRARNIGIKISKGNFIVFLDDDVELASNNFLNSMIQILKKHGETVGGLTALEIETRKPSLKTIVRKYYDMFFLINRFIPTTMHILRKTKHGFSYVDMLGGSVLAFKKNILEKFLFDESINFGEDLDISLRIGKSYKLAICEKAKFYHHKPEVLQVKKHKIFFSVRSYLFKKTIDQSSKNKLIFYWSKFGLLISNFLAFFYQKFCTKLHQH